MSTDETREVVAPTPDDWPIDGLLRGRFELDRWARKQGILANDQTLVIEVRAVPRGDGDHVFGAAPRPALIVHYAEGGWTNG